jgi:hypothetical protein
MKNLTVWLGGLLALSLAAAPYPAFAGDFGGTRSGFSGSSECF